MRKLIIIILLVGFVFGCATVPVTGRKQLSLIGNDQLLPMSFQSYDEVLKSSKLSDDQEQVQRVKRVGVRIQAAVEEYMAMQGLSYQLDGFDWEFNLIDEDVVNAWAMPGGKVAFYTGIMPICKNDEGVAVVMGHEVAHAIANHGGERMSQGMVVQGMGTALDVALTNNPGATRDLFMQAFGVGAGLGMLNYSRQHESEADHIGLIFMAMAGYHPGEAPKFWERMKSQSEGETPPEFLSTHPSHENRIEDLNALIPEAMQYFKKGN